MPKFLKKTVFTALAITALALPAAVIMPRYVKAASCQPPAVTYGTVTSSLDAPEVTTYYVWSRMMASSAANNSYLLAVDNSNCYSVGGSEVPAASWGWVNHQDGNKASRISLKLSKGSHTFKLTGTKPDVKIDHIIITSDADCVPAGNGDNCDTAVDTTPPVVKINAPKEGNTVSGTVTVSAAASDSGGIAKAEYYLNSILMASKTTAPYDFAWDTAKSASGSQAVTVRAYDKAGNYASDTVRVNVRNGDAAAPTQPQNLRVTAAAYNKVKLTWAASTDTVGVAGYRISRNDSPLATNVTTTSYEDSTTAPGTTYKYQVIAYDAAGNASRPSSVVSVTTPAVSDSAAPQVPKQLTATVLTQAQVNLSWRPSSDNIGVTAYDIYRGQDESKLRKISTVETASFGDTRLRADSTYYYAVKARDAAGNTSPMSEVVKVTTPKKRSNGVIRGTVSDHKGRPIPYAAVIVSSDGERTIYRANAKGVYKIRRLEPGRYAVTYKARGHEAKTVSLKIGNYSVIKRNVKLEQR